MTLPVAESAVSTKIGDKVIVSLRTKDPRLARARFVAAYAGLQAHWEAIRVGPLVGHSVLRVTTVG